MGIPIQKTASGHVKLPDHILRHTLRAEADRTASPHALAVRSRDRDDPGAALGDSDPEETPGTGSPDPGVAGTCGTSTAPDPSGPAFRTRPGEVRHRRVYPDDRRLRRNRGRTDLSNAHPLVSAGSDLRARVRTKLQGLAEEAGLEVLPGEGSLTLATRYLSGGRAQIVDYIRLAAADQDPDAIKWLLVWDDLRPWEQRQTTLDDICAASGVSPAKMIKVLVGSAVDANCDVANLIAAIEHPKVVKTAIRAAKRLDGIEDRKLLFQHHRFVPVNKGATVNINASANAQANAAAQTIQDVPDFASDLDITDADAGPHHQPNPELKALEAAFTDGED